MVVVSMYSLFYFFPENLCTYYVPKIVKKKKKAMEEMLFLRSS